MRRTIITTLACAALVGAASVGSTPTAQARTDLPSEYVVSHQPGTLPEGIDVRADGTMYVSSVGTGVIHRGNVASDRLAPYVSTDRGISVGIHSDPSGRIWSVGGDELTVHAPDGTLLATRHAEGGPLTEPYLNDLVVTPQAVYVTDWNNPYVYRASLQGRHVGQLEKWLDIRPAWPGFPAQYWLLNGIVADRSGDTLLVASNGTEAVWRVDTASREVAPVDLGDTTYGPDGMLLVDDTLYSVVNYGLPSGVYVARLNDDLTAGEVTHTVLDERFDTPTTLDRRQCRLYVVNSQLEREPGTPPYTVVAVPDPTC